MTRYKIKIMLEHPVENPEDSYPQENKIVL